MLPRRRLVNSAANDSEDNCLCEAHKAFLIRYMDKELRRQEQVAKRLLLDKRVAVVGESSHLSKVPLRKSIASR
jgi:hypothetical protein